MNWLQFGFRKNNSTVDALLFFIESVCEIVDSNNFVQTAHLGLMKAFDFISHDILLDKLKNGFDIDAENILKSFLSNRFQSVKLNLVFSNRIKIVRGLNQGTILGPLLLNL